MAIAYVDSVLKQGSSQAGSGNSAAKDTTVSSINFFALCRGILSGTSGSPTDSTGSNTWTRAVTNDEGSNIVEIWYVENPTTSGSHTFASTVNGYDAIAVGFYSGVGTSSFDQSNGNSGTSTSMNTGSVTPGVNNELLVAATSENWNGINLVADSSFNATRQYGTLIPGTSWAIAFADQIQTTATARDVTFSATAQTGTNLNACIATFKEATGGGGLVGPLIRGGMLTHGSLIRGGRLAA